MRIDPDDPRLPSVQIADAIRKDIADDVLKPGKRLPTHRHLAERFGVATQTVQNGLRILRDEGLIRSAGARGSFVADEPRPQRAGATGDPGAPTELEELRDDVAQLKERVAALERLVRRG